jgi:hypothetical protein
MCRDATEQPADLEGKHFDERLHMRERERRKSSSPSTFDIQHSKRLEKEL